jgi:hypothetical protein
MAHQAALRANAHEDRRAHAARVERRRRWLACLATFVQSLYLQWRIGRTGATARAIPQG